MSLCSNPLWQLNVVLWMLISPKPQEGLDGYHPLLKQSGYELYALERTLTPTGQTAVKLKTLFSAPADTKWRTPELIARPVKPGLPWLVIECKASAISGPNSDSSRTYLQAIHFLIVAADLSVTLAEPTATPVSSEVVYVTHSSAAPEMVHRLQEVEQMIAAQNVQSVPWCVVGLGVDEVDDLRANVHVPPHKNTPTWAQVLSQSAICNIQHRPMMLIPMHPDCKDDEQVMSSAWARVTLLASCMVDKLAVGAPVVLEGKSLLSKVTLGIADYWASGDSKKNLIRKIMSPIRRIVEDVAATSQVTVKQNVAKTHLTLTFSTVADRDKCAHVLAHATVYQYDPEALRAALKRQFAHKGKVPIVDVRSYAATSLRCTGRTVTEAIKALVRSGEVEKRKILGRYTLNFNPPSTPKDLFQ